MSRLKILMLGWEFPPVINGGLGIACLGMAKSLSKIADVSVILPKSDPNFVVDNVELIGLNNLQIEEVISSITTSNYSFLENVDFIETELLPYSTQETRKTKFDKKQFQSFLNNVSKEELDTFKADELYGPDIISKVVQYAKFAARIALTKDFDVIHAHDWMTFLAGIEVKRLTGKPLAVHVHSLSYDRSGPDSRGWLFDVEKYGMEQADMVMPVSAYTGDICVTHFGIDKAKIFPVHNGALEVEPFRQEKSFPGYLVLFLGRLTEQKGPEIFLNIASEVLKKNNNIHFVMAGTGDQMKHLIESGAYKHVGNKFHFTGFLSKEKVNDLLSMTDVYCMPSVSEPFGLSALEAAQFAIPAVISKQSGVAEVLHGALKADFWDVELMSQHIVSLIEDKELKEKVVKAGFKDLEKLTWDAAAIRIVDIVNEFLNKK